MNVVDASVIVAAFKPGEAGHAEALAWYSAELERGLIAPSVLLAEVSAGIARSTGDDALAERAVRSLRNVSTVVLVEVTTELAATAADLARQHRIRGCDAIYVALAATRRLTLITLDEEQIARGGRVGRVERPRAVPPGEH